MRRVVFTAVALVAYIAGPVRAQSITVNGSTFTVPGQIIPLTILNPPSTGTDITNACSNGNVYLGPGTFPTSAPIVCPSNRLLEGSGKGNTTITWTNGTDCVITRDGVHDVVIRDLSIANTGTSATKMGVCDFNAAGPNLRNALHEVRIIGDQNPPVTGTFGHYVFATTTNSLYYMEDEHVDVLNWDRCWNIIGLDFPTSGGASANRFIAPQGNACVRHFNMENFAAANTVVGLHCNGAGTTYAQDCLSLGDGTTTRTQGNVVQLYADMGSPSSGTNRPYHVQANAQKNVVVSYTSVSQGIDDNVNGTSLNNITEMNVNATRSSWQFGNWTIIADKSTPTLNVAPNGSGNFPTLNSLSANTANTIGWHFRTNVSFTAAGECLMDIANNATRQVCFDLNGAVVQTGVPFANLSVPAAPANGAIQYCSDCTITATCAGSGTGAIAKRLNGVWVCN